MSTEMDSSKLALIKRKISLFAFFLENYFNFDELHSTKNFNT